MAQREINVIEVTDSKEKLKVSREILEALQKWFGVVESREEYIKQSEHLFFLGALKEEHPVGFLCLKQTGKQTVELAVMGVLEDFHRKGIGRELFFEAKKRAIQMGYEFMQVKTVKTGYYKVYDETNYFYRSLGFKELEVFPSLWDEKNPCQIYIMKLV